MELAISWALRFGVGVSLVLLVAGTVCAFWQPGGYGDTPADFARLLARPDLRILTFSGFWEAACLGRGVALLAPGLLLLIVTPLLRVGVSILGYALERDGLYVVITALVFALVVVSFFWV